MDQSTKNTAIYVAGSQIGTFLSVILQQFVEIDATVSTAGLIAITNIVLFVINRKFKIW